MSIKINNEYFNYIGASFESQVADNLTFGIIRVEANEEEEEYSNRFHRKIDVQIRIDNSGSMSDICSDGRTKMQHVNFAVSQILRKISEGRISATVDIRSFDDAIVSIIADQLNLETVEEMVSRVNRIFPNAGTNIQNVLTLETRNQDTPVERVFILLSDGQDTTGIGRDKLIRIAESIDANTNVIMIGVGNDHDSALFKGIISKRGSGHYTPVSNVEEISIAISELIYGILHKVLKRLTITVSNGEIYSWSKNKWVNCIQIEDIVIGRKKTFHIRSNTPLAFAAKVEGVSVEDGDNCVVDIVDIQFGAVLTYDKHRHRTMELIGESVMADEMSSLAVKELKTQLKNMMIELKAYMDKNQLRDDKRYQMLCDDIFMCHQTMGSVHGTMYAAARQTSQGTQSIYSNQRNLPSYPRPPKFSRGITGFVSKMNQDEIYDEFDEFDLPPCQPMTMMRSVSHGIYQMSQSQEVDDTDLESLLKKFQPITIVEEEEEEVDDAMRNHQMLASDDSPYANLKELTFIREVSLGKHNSI